MPRPIVAWYLSPMGKKASPTHSEEDVSESDSHNYTMIADNVSSISQEDVNDEPVKEENALLRFVRSIKYIQNFLVGLSILTLCPLLLNVNVLNTQGTANINLGFVALKFSILVFVQVFLAYLIFYVSRFLMNTVMQNSSVVYYINETDQYIAITILVPLIFIGENQLDFYLSGGATTHISSFDILRIIFVTSLLMCLAKMCILKLRKSINYNAYMGRIKRQMLENVLLNFFRRKGTMAFSNRVFNYSVPPWSLATKRNNLYTFDGESDSLWRIALTEFQGIRRAIPNPHENFKRFLRLVKSHSKKLSARNEFKYLIDMRECAPNYELFKALVNYLGLKENLEMNYGEIYKLVERNYKEYYYLRSGIRHTLLASQRLLQVLHTFILLMSLVFCLLKGTGKLKIAAAFLPAMFGVGILFKESVKNMIDGIVLLFVIHPFGIGDRVFINLDGEMTNLVVSKQSLVSTIFYRWDGTFIHIPNFVLLQKAILNIKRSQMLFEKHRIQVACFTEKDKIEKLRFKLKNYVKSNSEVFTDNVHVFYDSIENVNKLHMCVMVQFRGNWQNYEMYLQNKGDFLSALNEYLRELKIDYELLPQRVKLVDEPVAERVQEQEPVVEQVQ